MAERIFGNGPVPGLEHDCGDELRRLEATLGMAKPGEMARCSCGNLYALRDTPFLAVLFGVGRPHHRGVYASLNYWHHVGRDPQ